MKRKMCVLLSVVLCVFALFPVTAYAETYNLGGTDMSISVDDTSWYVFTRDNIKHNSELDELGLSYDTMYSVLYDNEAYMDAILLYDDGQFAELLIRKRTLDTGIVNLSNYDNEQVLELAEGLAERQGTNDYSVYENQYKFAKLEYLDSSMGYYICEFVTIVNKDNYTLTFQTTLPFTDWEYDEIEDIVDSINFDIDTSLKEKKPTTFSDTVIEKAIVGGISGAMLGGIASLYAAIKNKKKKNSEKSEVN